MTGSFEFGAASIGDRVLGWMSRSAILVTAFFSLLSASPADPEKGTALAVGTNAKTGVLQIPVNLPVDFNWKTRAQILDMRTREVNKFPQLLAEKYVPLGAVYNAIEDGKPWWGTAGTAVWGTGNRSIEGPSEESRFVMNPFLLVAANPGNLYIWDPGAIQPRDIKDPSFPYFWQPEKIEWSPKSAVATASYNISKYQQEIVKTTKLRDNNTFCKQFSLVAYNAKDFGYHYIYLDEKKSINVLNDNNPDGAAFIKQFIHCGGTCGYPGGCNNMSPFMPQIDRCRFTRLPARAVVCLWKNAPQSVAQRPDMYFLLEFR